MSNDIFNGFPEEPTEEMPLAALRNSPASPNACNLRTPIPCKHSYGAPDCSDCPFNGANAKPMTVADLITALQGYPPDAIVMLSEKNATAGMCSCVTLMDAQTATTDFDVVVLSARVLGEE